MNVVAVVIEAVKSMAPEKGAGLTEVSAQHITLRSLELDSLDTLQLAMNIEDALGIDIAVVDFPDGLTLAELAELLSQQLGKEKCVQEIIPS